MKMISKISWSIAMLILAHFTSHAQLTVNGGGAVSANALVSNLIGSGVTFSNATYSGANIAVGTFNGSASNIGLPSGVILTSGSLNVAPGPNNNGGAGFSNQGPQITELNAIAQSPTRDGAILEFDFVPQSNLISFKYVFASEEYNEYVCSEFNDAFAFLISGPGITGAENLAVVPSTTIPITINTINGGAVGALGSITNSPCILGNSAYYVFNTGNTVQYDGWTTVLTAQRTVIPCQTYHIRLMIADGFDDIFDSAVFLEENSFNSAVYTASVSTPFGDTDAIEGCVQATVNFTRPNADSTPLTINFTTAGNALWGVDYTPFPLSITIPAGQTTAGFNINAIEDFITEGDETLIINAISPCGLIPVTVTLKDKPPINLSVPNAGLCNGQGPATLTATATGGVQPITFLWNTGQTSASISVNPPTTTLYTVTATDFCGTTATANPVVAIQDIPTASINLPPVACSDFPVQVNYTGTAPPSATYIWDFDGASNVTSGSSQGPYQVTWSTSGIKTVSLQVIENGCASNTVTAQIMINPTPTADFVVDPIVCAGQIAVVGYTGTGTDGGGYGWGFPGGSIITGGRRGPFQIVWDSVGVFGVSLTVTENGCTSPPFVVNVTVQPTPTSDFTAVSPVCVNENSTISYNGTASSTASYNWNFAGGNVQSGSGAGPYQVSWATAGTKDLFLTVTENGCTGSVTNVQVIVRPLPTASFTVTTPVCTGQAATVTYSGNANVNSTFNWNFGTATVLSGSGMGPYQVLWNDVGTYPISLTVIRNGCQSPPVTQNVNVFQTPSAPFSVVSPVCTGQTSQIQYAGSLVNATFNWSFSGGQVVSGFGPGPYQVYWDNEGDKNIQLMVTNSNGCPSLPQSQIVQVLPTPTSIFTVTTPVCEGDPATVQYTGTGQINASYFWDFNGGTIVTGSGQGPYEVAWPIAGIKNISIQVIQDGCISAPGTQQVLVKPRPTGFFTAQSPVCAFETSQLVYSGTSGANALYNWNVDNGIINSGSGIGPLNVYWETAGVKEIKLVVIDDGCSSVEVIQPVVVNPIPTPDFQAQSPICLGDLSAVNYSGTGTAFATYNWDFGDANIISGSSQGPFQLTWDTAGLKPIVLFVSENGCTSPPDTQFVLVHPIPTSPFTASPTVCVGQPATIQYAGANSLQASYNWDFNGGTIQSGSGQGPFLVSWNTPGIKNISLIVVENGCISPQTFVQVNVSPYPTSTFTASPLACNGQLSTVQFTGTALSNANYNWNFGGATVVNGTGPGPYQLTWDIDGPKIVTLTVEQNGCPSAPSQVQINVAPSPSVNAGPDAILCSGDSIQFGINPVSGYSYLWNSNTGLSSTTVSNPVFSYQNLSNTPFNGQYILSVSLGGCTVTDTLLVQVLPQPQVNWQLPAGQCQIGNSFNFSANGNLTLNATYLWTFGTAANHPSLAEQNPSGVTFNTPGLHPITLTVSDWGCGAPVYQGFIEVFAMPQALFQAENFAGCPPLKVQFNNLSTFSDSLTYQWSFGDNSSSTFINGTHSYLQSGSYSVTLAATSLQGCTAYFTSHGAINVFPQPIAGFDIDNDVVRTDNPLVNIYDRSVGASLIYYTSGHGQNMMGPNAHFVYESEGNFTITQFVENEFGCRDTAQKQLKTEPVITFYVPNAFTPNSDGANDEFLCFGLNIKDFRMEIYNRWGELVFESNDINRGWNGRLFNQNDQEISQMDVYAFVVYVTDTFDNPRRRIDGTVTLVK